MKSKLAILLMVLLLLLAGCGMSRKEAANAVAECEAAGMSANLLLHTWGAEVECVPPEVVHE